MNSYVGAEVIVNPELKAYVEEHIFPEYAKNDGGHNLAHIKEVIRRSFELNEAFGLQLKPDLIYTIAACHDWGKYEDHEKHHLIAARNFANDDGLKKFFTVEERQIIKEAIEDHRSSKEDEPRSVYGKLVSSADRNSRIDIVFIRSFFVAKERMPDENIEDYLNFTIERLSKRYSEEDSENMFFEDENYRDFLKEMRELLKNEDEFKRRYCEVNHISSRQHKVKEEPGAIEYL
ncbi:MAG: HD domain-containing protein [Candidatus Saccharibacteria bacterium]|nr:HD domain-containing protein [Candidatus Saccharibacteria bacterium]